MSVFDEFQYKEEIKMNIIDKIILKMTWKKILITT